MEQGLKHGERMEGMKGRSILLAFDAGVVPALMDEGYSLENALAMADKAGHMTFVSEVKNLVTTLGRQLAASVLVNDISGSLMFTYHAIGTGTTAPAYSDSALTTETARNPIVTKVLSGNYILMRTFYVASLCTAFIKEAGTFGGAASATPGSGTLFNHYLQSYDNTAGLKDLTFLYNLEV